MKKTKQGALLHSKVLISLVSLLLVILFCLAQNVSAATDPNVTEPDKNHAIDYNVHLIYLPESKLQSSIAQHIAAHLDQRHNNIHLKQLSPTDSNTAHNIEPDLVIAIGTHSIKYTDISYQKIDTLLIASNPTVYNLSKTSDNSNTVLYMSQPYCKQIQFIKEINRRWKTVSYLTSKEKPVDGDAMNKCAKQHAMTTHRVSTTQDGYLSSEIKDALANSDLILALPNKDIYNEKSIKNILLSSYRNRKPVIGFSKNFVNAGALASIYSNAEQIADSANQLVDQYYEQDKKFRENINYPKTFDISINKQVFRALNLRAPNLETLRQKLKQTVADKPGRSE